MKINTIQKTLNFKQDNPEAKNNKNIVYLNDAYKNAAMDIKFQDSFVKLSDDEFNKFKTAQDNTKRNSNIGVLAGVLSSIPAGFSVATAIKLGIKPKIKNVGLYAITTLIALPATLLIGDTIAHFKNKKYQVDLNIPYDKYIQNCMSKLPD